MALFRRSAAVLAGGMVLGLGVAAAQTYEKPAPPAGHAHGTQGEGAKVGHAAALKASLVDAEAKARQQAATVKVDVTGVKMVDPATVNEKPMKDQGHLHYQVDDGPVIATTAGKLSFHGLKPGTHRITVALAANDHSPLGPQQVLQVTIPPATAGR
jgi:hypothetical protein